MYKKEVKFFMAITNISPITSTVGLALDYITRHKIEKVDGEIEDYINKIKDTFFKNAEYIERKKDENLIIYKTLSKGINCNYENANKAFSNIKKMHNKNDGNLAYHVWQNFGEQVDPIVANEIAVKLAKELYGDYQCVVSTHTNTQYTHNHIIFNSVAIADGKKFNDCLQAVQDLRTISDKLCEEYGLSVLENTKNMKLIKYKDERGNTKFFEPTARKNEKTKKYSNVNDYRNTEKYIEWYSKKDSHRQKIENDIDELLPYVSSYDELLNKLKNIGYDIKSKTKNGNWRKHISIRGIDGEKHLRDTSLGKENEYTRANLEKKILKNLEKKTKVAADEIQPKAKEVENKVLVNINVDDIDDNYKRKKEKDKYVYKARTARTDIEKYIIKEVKNYNKELNAENRNLKYINYKNDDMTDSVAINKKSQYLLDRINSNLKTLKFVEDKDIKSFNEINNTAKLLYEKKGMVYKELEKVSNALKFANKNIVTIEKYNELKKVIEENKKNNDEKYLDYELSIDENLLKSYEIVLKQRKLFDPENQEIYKSKISNFEKTYEKLKGSLEVINNHIKDYDECVYNLKNIKDNRYDEDIQKYYDMRKESFKDINNREDR